MPLQVAILWHMHQPYYVDPVRQTALMPWVRLHATKGYLDMAWLIEQFPDVQCIFNLTPVLLKQIEQLATGEVRDAWHELAAAPAETLTPAQKTGILEHFFKANWDNMVRPFPRYGTLLQKRGLNTAVVGLDRIAGNFTEQDYRDLQVWFNLTWFGYAADELYPEIAELKRKGQGFTEADKRTVFDHQQTVLRNLAGYYKALTDRGQIEISTTPFYHPILPLVHSTDHASRCMPGAKLPPVFSHPEDVRAQLALARDYHEKLFGQKPAGCWPSEGSVCPELIPILQELGYEWLATDEEVLWRSLATVRGGEHVDRAELFQGYRVEYGGANVCAAFRDRTLSDFIGFSAARNEPVRAAEFMVGHLEAIARSLPDGEPLCAVILDGENAWENFRDGGQAFLREFYTRLAGHGRLQTTKLHEYFAAHPPVRTIPTLYTGSWINANFSIWIGHPEDNRGWELLGRTRDFLQLKADRHEITPEQFQKGLQEIYAAEGSDWFWWYGDDFVTENDLIFDELFRTHLQNVYHIVGALVPDVLKAHICRSEVVHETSKPTDLITPEIDGQITSYYEWAGAGVYEAGRAMGAMYRSDRLVESIHFGGDLRRFYLRVDFRCQAAELPGNLSLRINFIRTLERAVVIKELAKGVSRAELWETGSSKHKSAGELEDLSLDRVLELAVDYRALGWNPKDQGAFFIQLLQGGIELERHPAVGTINFAVPDENFDLDNWRV